MSKAQNLMKITVVTCLVLFTLNNVIFWTKIGKDATLEKPQSQIRALLDSLLDTKVQSHRLGDVYDLCLATTWTRKFQKGPVHKVVVKNWASLSERVKPVLVSREEHIRMELNSSDWSIIPEVETECDTIPTLRGVLKEVISNFTSKLYGFSNGDLIFGKDFWNSVKMVLRNRSLLEKPLLILGKRINVKFNLSETYNIHDIPTIAKRGSYPMEGSSDIFITNKLFPWSNIPKIVVGRMALGMWFVGYARAQNATLIDVTNTSTILHLTTKIGIHESGYARNYSFNIDLLHKLGFDAEHFQLGSLDCVDRFTEYDTKGEVIIKQREVEPVCYIPIQGDCNYNGQLHKAGASFKSSDGCNTCGCGGNGMIFCTQRACINTCSYNGQTYFPGQGFKSADGCNECGCQNSGAVVCTERACATLV